ncbi:hypothetical protein [Tautonia rosea]|uniref:hypothetical protein n=1 Tax=Tautonia rosea TaxID=2728037 RepID=UPI001F2A150B|nr:hypothetical protein [Tautonia rosea]
MAHEVGIYVFCPEQWRLEYGLGLEPENRPALQTGSRHHARKAEVERSASRLLALGKSLLAAAGILLLILWILGR